MAMISDQTDPFIANLGSGIPIPFAEISRESSLFYLKRLLGSIEDLLFDGRDDRRSWEDMSDEEFEAKFNANESYSRSQRMIVLWTMLDRNR